MRNFSTDQNSIITEYENVVFDGQQAFEAKLEEYLSRIDPSMPNTDPAVYTAQVFLFIAEHAPSENSIHFEWLDSEDTEYSIFYRIKNFRKI